MKPNSKISPLFLLFYFVISLFSASLIAVKNPAHAAAGINEQINFQGKVVNTNGTNVSNGDYDFVFKIWDDPTAGSTVWTETWNSGTSQVTVTDGVFRVALGTHTTLPGSVDFNTDNLYLSVNFNGDGDMTPRVRFSAVPYAFNAMMLGGQNNETVANGTDDEITFTGVGGSNNQALTFDLDDASRTVITSSTSTSIGIDEDLVFIGAQTISTSTGDLTIGTNDVNFTATGGSTGDADVDVDGYLQVGGTAEFDGAINADSTLTVASTLTANGNTIIGNANSDTLTINAGTSGTGITFADASFASCTALETDASGDLTCGSDDGGTTYWNTIGDAAASAGIEFASYLQTMDWTDSNTDGSYFAFNFDNNDSSAGTDNFVVINNAVSTNSGGVDLNTENLLLLQQLDTTASGTTIVDNALKIDSAANSAITDAIEITNSGGNLTNAINIADDAGGLITTGINYSGTLTTGIVGGATFTTAIDLSSGSSTTDLILDDGLTIAQTSDADLDIVEGGLTLNVDFGETAGSTITESSASSLEYESTANAASALKLESTLGGIDIFASGAGAGEDIDITATGSSVNLTSTEGVADGIVLTSTGGGIDITSTGAAAGEDFDFSSSASVNISAAEAAVDAIVLDSSTDASGVRIIAGDNEATTIGNGNDIELKAEDDTIITLTAAGQLVVDAATNVDSTATTGTIDIDVDTITDTASGLNLNFQVGDTAGNITAYGQRTDVTVDSDASQSQTVTGQYIGITANDATSTTYGMQIIAEDAGGQVVTAGLVIDNLQATDIDLTTGILIRATTNDSIATAIDVSDGEITTALSVGANAITGTTGLINYTNFDVDAAGGITVAAAEGLDTNGAGALELGKANATSVDLCNSANCDTVNIGNLATTDADTIIIGDVLDNVSITGDQWSITDAGVLTVASCTGCGGGGGTLQQAYDAGSAGDQIITLDGTQDSIEIDNPSSSGTDSGFAFQVDQNNTGAVDGIRILQDGTGDSLEVTNSSTGLFFNLVASGSGTTADGLLMANSSSGAITDALDVSDAEIVNALNVGQNFILGDGIRQFSSSSTVWTFEDTSGNDLMTITDAGTTGNIAISGTTTANGDVDFVQAGTENFTITTSTTSTGNSQAMSLEYTVTPSSASTNTYDGLNIVVSSTANMNSGFMRGMYIEAGAASGGGGQIIDVIEVQSRNASTDTIAGMSGIYIFPTVNSGGGTITDNYGIYVDDQTILNTTNDYGIYVAGAATYALWVDAGTTRLDAGVTLTNFTSCTALETDGSGVLTCGTDDGGAGAFTSGSGIITKTTAADRLSLVYGDAGDVQLEITNTAAATAPTSDVIQLNLTGGSGVSTDNVDGIYVNIEGANGTSTDVSAVHIDFDPIAGSSDDTFSGLLIDGLTATSAVEYGINIGAGWDTSINTVQGAATQALVVDAAATDNTTTAGVIDLNVDTTTSDNIGLNIDYIVRDAGSNVTAAYGERLNITIDSDASQSHTAYGLYISADNDDASSTIYGLYVDADGDGGGTGTEYAAAFMDGGVGIGTATPLATYGLDVVASGNAGIAIRGGATSDSYITLDSGGSHNMGIIGQYNGGSARLNFVANGATMNLNYQGLAVSTLVSCNTIDTDSNGLMTCGTDEGGVGGGTALDSFTASTTDDAAILSGDNTISWQWALTSATSHAFTISESAASTGGSGNQFLLDLTTSASSTAGALIITGAPADAVNLQDINLTITGDADADTVNALNIDITSANTGDADDISAIRLSVTSPDATVREHGITIGSGFDDDVYFASSEAKLRIQSGGRLDITDPFNGGNGTADLPLGRFREYFSDAGYGVWESGGFINIDGSFRMDNFITPGSATADVTGVNKIGDNRDWNVDEAGTGAGGTNTQQVGCNVGIGGANTNISLTTNDQLNGQLHIRPDTTTVTTTNAHNPWCLMQHSDIAGSNATRASQLKVANKFIMYYKVRLDSNYISTNGNGTTRRYVWLGANQHTQGFYGRSTLTANNNFIGFNNLDGASTNTGTNALVGTSWIGWVQNGTAATNISTVDCSANPTVQTATNGWALMRIEARDTSTNTSGGIHFFIDGDVSNGVNMTECGSGIQTDIPTGMLRPSILAAQGGGSSSVTWSLIVDLFAMVQDDRRDAASGLTENIDEAVSSGSDQKVNPIQGADVAEHFFVPDGETLEPGDIAVQGSNPGYAVISAKPYDRRILGVVSESPGLEIGERSSQTVPIALSGRVPVKVNNKGGIIHAGDPITTSDKPGVGMRAKKAGKIIGTAMEAFDGKEGKIMVQVSSGYYLGDELGLEQEEELSFGPTVIASESAHLATDSAHIASAAANLESGPLTRVQDFIYKGLVEFWKKVTFKDVVEFWAEVLFKHNVKFEGQVEFSKDSAGYATIKKGERFVDVTFEREYAVEPIVNISVSIEKLNQEKFQELIVSGSCDAAAGIDGCQDKIVNETLADDLKAGVSGKSVQGFMILLSKQAPVDITFSWQAVAVKEAKTSVSKSTDELIQEFRANDVAGLATGPASIVSSDSANLRDGEDPITASGSATTE